MPGASSALLSTRPNTGYGGSNSLIKAYNCNRLYAFKGPNFSANTPGANKSNALLKNAYVYNTYSNSIPIYSRSYLNKMH